VLGGCRRSQALKGLACVTATDLMAAHSLRMGGTVERCYNAQCAALHGIADAACSCRGAMAILRTTQRKWQKNALAVALQ
jgi:hypothetical protein